MKGNAVTDGIHTFAYDDANQPITATGGSAAASYAYDGNLKRVKSVVGLDATYFFYSRVTGTLIYADAVSSGEENSIEIENKLLEKCVEEDVS